MTTNELAHLAGDWCQHFDLHRVDEGLWTVVSPFIYSDGDGLPVFIRESEGGWDLSDLGMAVSHLFFDDYEFTEARFRQIERAVEMTGATIASDDREITFGLDKAPTAFDIADFIQIVAQVQGIARSQSTERRPTRYVTQVRDALAARLPRDYFEEGVEENWAPPTSGRGSYKVDLKLPAKNDPIALFIASTSQRVYSAAFTVDQCRKAKVPMIPLLAYQQGQQISDDVLNTFSDYSQDESSMISVDPASPYNLERRLGQLGVPVS